MMDLSADHPPTLFSPWWCDANFPYLDLRQLATNPPGTINISRSRRAITKSTSSGGGGESNATAAEIAKFARSTRENRGINIVNYCATCLVDAVSWGTRPPLFHRLAPQRGSLRTVTRRVRVATQASSSSPPPPPPRPVASWGPRYRYDVDIWRTLLFHPRPACISVRARATPEWSLLDVTPLPGCGVPGKQLQDIQTHCSARPLWRRPTPRARSCDTVLL